MKGLMARNTLAVVLCGLLTVAFVDASLVSFVAEKTTVSQGEPIKLTCTYNQLSSEEKQHLNKHVLNNTYHLDPEDVTENPRFKFGLSSSGNAITEIMTINGTVPGDAGNYSCSIFNIQTKLTSYLFLVINVEVEPTNVTFYVNDQQVSSNQTVKLKPLAAYQLACKAAGSNPAANITISYGTVKLNLTSISNFTYQLDQSDRLQPFVVPMLYNTTAFTKNWVFDSDAYEAQIICLAKVNKNASALSTSFIPIMDDGVPQFECNDTAYAADGQRNFVINCTVYAKPALTASRFTFAVATKNYDINGFPLNQGHPDSDDRNYVGIVRQIDRIKYNMSLTIATANVKAKTKFSFMAENGLGRSMHAVTLTDKSAPSAASSIASATSLVVLLLATVSFVQSR